MDSVLLFFRPMSIVAENSFLVKGWKKFFCAGGEMRFGPQEKAEKGAAMFRGPIFSDF
jgi:hypothetical protein